MSEFAKQLTSSKPVHLIPPASMEQAAQVEKYRHLAKGVKEEDTLHIMIGDCERDPQGKKLSIDGLCDWLDANEITYNLVSTEGSKRGEATPLTREDMRNDTSRSNYFQVRLDINGMDSIRKLAVAKFTFPGAEVIRDMEQQLFQQAQLTRQNGR